MSDFVFKGADDLKFSFENPPKNQKCGEADGECQRLRRKFRSFQDSITCHAETVS